MIILVLEADNHLTHNEGFYLKNEYTENGNVLKKEIGLLNIYIYIG